MSNYLLTNYKSPYLQTLASNFERQTKYEAGIVLPEKQNLLCNNLQRGNKTNWGYYSGVAATIGQVIAGLLMIPASLLEKRNNKKTEFEIDKLPEKLPYEEKKVIKDKIMQEFGSESVAKCLGDWLNKKGKYKILAEKLIKNNEKFQKIAKRINHVGWVSLGLSYLVSIPACIGASIQLKQPSMFIGSILWAITSPFMMQKKFEDSPKLKGFLMLGYAFNYLGLANKIKNEKENRKGNAAIEFDFKRNKDNLFNKTAKFFNFSLKDHITMPEAFVNAFKQTWDYISGKRKEVPEYMSASPSSDNRKITSFLLYGGGIPLMIFGKKCKPLEKIANIMIGTGMLLDAVGLFAIGRAEKGATKAALLTGVPLRAVGDFAQTNNFMYGLRTLGGASFEYYFASLNQCGENNKDKQETKSG